MFGQLGAAGRVRQHRMLHDVLRDRLDQRIVAYRLYENRAVVVARCGGHVHLDREAQIFLQQAMVDILDALEPGQARIVDMVRLVIEHREFIDLAHDLAQVGITVRRFADRLCTERR